MSDRFRPKADNQLTHFLCTLRNSKSDLGVARGKRAGLTRPIF